MKAVCIALLRRDRDALLETSREFVKLHSTSKPSLGLDEFHSEEKTLRPVVYSIKPYDTRNLFEYSEGLDTTHEAHIGL